MIKNKNRFAQRAFTLIELLVVVAIIGVLSTIVFVSYDKSQSKARDARRMTDVSTISKAALLLYDDTKSFGMSGYGYNGATYTGMGYFNYVGTGYQKSINQGLVDNKYLVGTVIDPTGTTSKNVGDGDEKHFYMYYFSTTKPNRLSVYATLENGTEEQKTEAAKGECDSTGDCVATYGVNYAVTSTP